MGGLFRWLAITLAAAGLAGGAHFALRTIPHIAGNERLQEAQRTLPERISKAHLSLGAPVFIRIFKEEAELEVWMKGAEGWRKFQTYAICRFSGGLGPKLREGDRQAPEGFYRVTAKQLNPHSRHHLAFNLGFPNSYDRAHGRTGSYLMVHGGCSSIGCYAMTDANVDDIYRLTEAALARGQKAVDVHIFPFRMSPGRMAEAAGSRWEKFWRDLKPAHDYFEARREVPRVTVEQGRYRLKTSS